MTYHDIARRDYEQTSETLITSADIAFDVSSGHLSIQLQRYTNLLRTSVFYKPLLIY